MTPDRFPLPHVSILASAGSGKTFQLTNRYLTLVAAGAPIGGLLASTFTRVAAAEIRDRILLRLADAADDAEGLAELAVWIGRPALDRSEVLGLLRGLTSNLHLLRIRTLDSFFDSVVRAYAIELGIPPSSRIVDVPEARALRHEAIREVLDTTTSDALVRLLRRMTQGSSDRSVMNTIDYAVLGLYELYRETDGAAWTQMRARRELTARALADAIDEIDDVAPAQKGMVKALRKDIEHARAGDWEALVKTGIAAKIARGATTYGRATLPPDILEAYGPLVDHAKAVLWNRIARQTSATRDLLELFDKQFQLVKQRRRALTFDDLTAAMTQAMTSAGSGHFDEICFRLDATVDHLLLDEFQDTNVQQWRALAPIVTEIIDDTTRDRTFFCVGDVKQSIFGWRDACPEVFDELPGLRTTADGSPAIKEQKLSESFRSSPVVIDVVNRVFGSIRDFPAMRDHGRAAAQFAAGFDDHITRKTKLAGYAELRTVRRAPTDGDQKIVRLRDAADLVAKLHRQAPSRRIAVLTRTNASVARLLFEFSGGRLDIPATGRGGGPLTDAPSVNAILDLLTLADHPDDTVAAFNVARGPLGPVVELTDESAVPRRRRVARDVRRRLVERGYAETIAGWTTDLASSCDERGFRRLLQLIDLAGIYDQRATLRADDFVRTVEQLAVADTAPAPVQVMTVHQAKGLEFDIVVLPDLEEKLVGATQPPVVFERDGGTGPVTRVCRWVNTDTRAVLPELEEMFEVAQQRTVRESLSLLYVALTRARQGLFMLIDPPKVRKNGAEIPGPTPAGVLRCALTDESTPEPQTVIFTGGDPIWISRETPDAAPSRQVGVSSAPVSKIKLGPPSPHPLRGLAAPSASHAAIHHASIAAELAIRDAEPFDRGSALHKLFEQVEWLEAFEPDRGVLLRHVRTTAPRRSTEWCAEIVDTFLVAIEHPAIRDILSLGAAFPERTRVWRERPFVRVVDGKVQQGSIDRLVTHLDESGRVCRATVIDFKSDRIEATEADARAERYRGQVEDYRAITAHIFGLDANVVEMTLLFIRPGVATTLSTQTRTAMSDS